MNATLITELILQDMRHYQLVFKLEAEDIAMEEHDSNIVEVVAELMGLLPKSSSDQFVSLYISYMEQAHTHPVCGTGRHLMPLAMQCYQSLLSCIDIEKRTGALT